MSMRSIARLALSSCVAVGVIACSSSAPPPQDEHKALQRAIQEPLDKARAAEAQLQKQQEAAQRELDDAGG